MRHRLIPILAALMACAWPLLAERQTTEVQPADEQHQSGSQPVPVFRTQTELVVVHANVFDGRAHAVGHLPRSAFQVFEDGVSQPIEYFVDRDVPVAVGLVIDNSTSMINRGPMVRAAVRTFAQSSREGDELFTVVFNEHARLGLPEGVPFTGNRHLLEASVARYPTGGKTALHDAVIEGLAHLEEASNQKRVLVVLSDGDDNASRQSESNMLYRATRSDALIYTIWTGDVADQPGNPRLLRKLAKSNGGVAYDPDDEADVADAFAEIAGNVRRGYSLGFVPAASADGRYHRLRVVVRHDGRTLSVRARDGYTAPDGTGR